jgi:hypothetical protein
MPTFRVHHLLAYSCHQFVSVPVLPGKFQETGCSGPKYLCYAIQTFPAIRVVEISGAVRQALSDFDVLHTSCTILIRELSRTRCLFLSPEAVGSPTPPQILVGVGNISPCLKVSYFFISLSRLLIDSFRLSIHQLLFIISLWVIQKRSLDSRSMGLSLGPSSTKMNSNQNLLVIMTSTSRLRHVGFAPLMFIPSVVDGARSTSLSALVMVIMFLCTFIFAS